LACENRLGRGAYRSGKWITAAQQRTLACLLAAASAAAFHKRDACGYDSVAATHALEDKQ